jgi:hypothetical protein
MNKEKMLLVVKTELKKVLPKFNEETYDHVTEKVVESIFKELVVSSQVSSMTWKEYPHLQGFNKWVADNTHRDDTLGLICRELVVNMKWPFRSISFQEMKDHLVLNSAKKDDIKGFEMMWKLFLKETTAEVLDGKKTKARPRKVSKKSGKGSKRPTRKG